MDNAHTTHTGDNNTQLETIEQFLTRGGRIDTVTIPIPDKKIYVGRRIENVRLMDYDYSRNEPWNFK
jgi:hypothetical protein